MNRFLPVPFSLPSAGHAAAAAVLAAGFALCAAVPAAGAPPPSRAPGVTAADLPPVLGDLAPYFAPDPPYRAAPGEDRLAVALGLLPAIEMGGPRTDVGLLRLAFVAEHHNVSGIDFSLAFARVHGAARGVQLSALNAVDGPFSGLQLGLLANVAGVADEAHSAGIQLAGLVNWDGDLTGGQLAAAYNRRERGAGLQFAVVANSADDFRGVQVAAVNLRGESFHGVQAGLLNGGASACSGLQLGVFANSVVALGSRTDTGTMDGWQVAALANAAGRVDGLQFALVNLAADVHGVQIGLYNQARQLHGVQIGLLNHCDASDLAFLPLLRVAL